ncbi:MAG: hypothetical protein KDB07_12370 [Planctomycetes bacterium]|nr:hypothetical protein [Planctomycetota bacterium]
MNACSRRYTLGLIALLALVLALTYRGWPSADGEYFLNEAEALLDQGHLGHDAISSNHQAFYRQAADGRFYGQSNEALMTISLIPFVAAARALQSALPDAYDALAPPFVAGLHAACFALFSAWLLIVIARRNGFAEKVAWLAALLFIVSTPMLHYSGRLFRDPMIVALFLLAFDRAQVWLARSSGRNALYFGLAMLVLMAARPPQALLLVAVVAGLATLGRASKVRTALLCALGLGLGFTLRAIWSASFTEPALNVDASSFSAIVERAFSDLSGSENLSAAGDAHEAIVAWWVPLARLAGMLVSPGAGLVFTAPLVVLGLVWAWRERTRKAALAKACLAIMALSLLGFAFYAAWFSGSWGVRYLLPAMALPCLFAAQALVRLRWPALRAAILGLALAIGIAGTLVNDRATVNHAPSFDASVTRRDQVWSFEHMPLVSHAKRVVAPDWSPLNQEALRHGWPSARRGVLAGWVPVWAIAYRAGVAGVLPLLAAAVLALLAAALAWWLARANPENECSFSRQSQD